MENEQRPGRSQNEDTENQGEEGEESKDPKMNTEYRKGFVTKEKIVRTPPEEQRKRMKMNMQN